MPGKLIVIDATDGCGKTTQFNKLIERLVVEGYEPETFKFPQYQNNQFGNLVACFLRGDFGDPTQMNPYLSSVLYAADRFESKKIIEKWLAQNKIVVLDRYVSANQIHQGCKIADNEKREIFLKWLDKIEHGVFGIPRPDTIIYLDVRAETSNKIMRQRGKLDKNESNLEYQKQSREQSLRLVSQMNNWERIICEEDGRLLPVDTIHKKIWAAVKKMV